MEEPNRQPEQERGDSSHRNATKWLFAIAFAAMVFTGSFYKVETTDIWMHLKAGEWIVSEKAIPRTDVFSHTADGQPWTYTSWLASVMLYFLHRVGGTASLTWLKALMTAATLVLVSASLRVRCRGSAAMALALVLVALVVRMRALARPLLFTNVLAASYVLAIECVARRKSPGGRGRIVLFPAAMLLWVNVHPGFLSGIALLVLAAVGELARDRTRALALAAAFALALLAALANPYGYRAFLQPFQIMGVTTYASAITEWQRTPLSLGLLPFWLLAAVATGSIILSYRQLLLRDALTFAGVLFLAVSAKRHVALFAIVSAPILVRHLEAAGRGIARRASRRSIVIWVLSAFCLCVAYASATSRDFGTGVRRDLFPIGATEFVAEREIRGNMFNAFNYGSYLIWRLWPEHRVYIDGRLSVYGESFFKEWRMAYSRKIGWREILDKHGVGLMVVEKGAPIAQVPDGWRTVYADEISAVLVRAEPSPGS